MWNPSIQLQNVKLQLNNVDNQFQMIISSMQSGMNMSNLVYNIAFQILNIGIQTFNIALQLNNNGVDFLDLNQKMINFENDLKQIQFQFQNYNVNNIIGINDNIKMNNSSFGIFNNRNSNEKFINIKFEIDDKNISMVFPENITVGDALKEYIEKNQKEEAENIVFLYNSILLRKDDERKLSQLFSEMGKIYGYNSKNAIGG